MTCPGADLSARGTGFRQGGRTRLAEVVRGFAHDTSLTRLGGEPLGYRFGRPRSTALGMKPSEMSLSSGVKCSVQ